jgi:hypothetical protein
MPYLNNVCIKGPKTDYNLEEIKPSIQKYVFKHLSNINKVLADIKQAEATVLEYKSNFCYSSIIVVSYRVDANRRYLDQKKVTKI